MKIGRHYVVNHRYEGGMGIAFRCEDERAPGQMVILKTYKDGPDRAAFRAAFTKEAQTWIALGRQQYLAYVSDVAVIDDRVFVEMEYYENGSLRDQLSEGPLAVDRAVALALQMVLAMNYVSDEQAILHLDLKPENILIGHNGEALITDLGLARAMSPTLGAGPLLKELDSAEGGVVGTVPYMSPEMIRGDAVDARADIWAWGAIVYELIMGQQPFQANDLPALAQSILSEQPGGWGRFRSRTPSTLSAVVAKCLSKDPASRFSSFRELAAELDSVIALGAGDTSPPFWRKDSRIHVTEHSLRAGWIIHFRPHVAPDHHSIRYTEPRLLVQAKQSRMIGNSEAALQALNDLFESEAAWGERWLSFMQQREQPAWMINEHSRGLNVLLGRTPLIEAAELRLAAFLDTVYDRSQDSVDDLVYYLKSCATIMSSAFKSPKLAELCGQLFMENKFFDDAADAFAWAWQHATSRTRASTASCILVFHFRQQDLARLRSFAESEVIPKLENFDDPVAQETCARAYIYLSEFTKALPYLRRAIALDRNRPWALTQACVAAWNSEEREESEYWYRKLVEVAPTSKYVADIEAKLPLRALRRG